MRKGNIMLEHTVGLIIMLVLLVPVFFGCQRVFDAMTDGDTQDEFIKIKEMVDGVANDDSLTLDSHSLKVPSGSAFVFMDKDTDRVASYLSTENDFSGEGVTFVTKPDSCKGKSCICTCSEAKNLEEVSWENACSTIACQEVNYRFMDTENSGIKTVDGDEELDEVGFINGHIKGGYFAFHYSKRKLVTLKAQSIREGGETFIALCENLDENDLCISGVALKKKLSQIKNPQCANQEECKLYEGFDSCLEDVCGIGCFPDALVYTDQKTAKSEARCSECKSDQKCSEFNIKDACNGNACGMDCEWSKNRCQPTKEYEAKLVQEESIKSCADYHRYQSCLSDAEGLRCLPKMRDEVSYKNCIECASTQCENIQDKSVCESNVCTSCTWNKTADFPCEAS
jgi:hypothetical protein